nr:MAG: capsid protein [Cressdnaviricota sp.]
MGGFSITPPLPTLPRQLVMVRSSFSALSTFTIGKMAWHKKRAPKRSYKKRSFKKAKRTWKKKSGPFRSKKSNIATSTETIDLGTQTAVTDTATTAATLNTTYLANYPRSALVAANYRFYRIAKVTYDYMPEANTYQAGLPTVSMIPRFISVMCRDGNYNGASSSSAGTVADLQEMGGKFRQFTKPIKISYAPNVCLFLNFIDSTGGSTPGGYITRKKSPWLSTLAESTASSAPNDGINAVHFGHQVAVVCDSFVSGQIAYHLKVTAHFEYKLPLAQVAGL